MESCDRCDCIVLFIINKNLIPEILGLKGQWLGTLVFIITCRYIIYIDSPSTTDGL